MAVMVEGKLVKIVFVVALVSWLILVVVDVLELKLFFIIDILMYLAGKGGSQTAGGAPGYYPYPNHCGGCYHYSCGGWGGAGGFGIGGMYPL